ncbi:MAG: hypothetical protein H7249_07455 [Chitinophagaceae bacterium]|nr:hypothetical protein [Oligoflexus sp.]
MKIPSNRWKRQKNEGQGRSGKKPLVFIAALLIGLFFYMKKRLAQSPTSSGSTLTDTSKRSVLPVILSTNSPKDNLINLPEQSVSGTAFASLTEESYNAMMANGLQEIPSTKIGHNLKFIMRLNVRAQGCSVGDFDLYKGLAENLSKKDFLVSLEPLGDKNAEAFKTRLSLDEVSAGPNQSVTLPDGDQDYGLFICYDSQKSDHCIDKAVLSAKDWSTTLNDKKKRDKALYFALITVKGERAFLMPGSSWEESKVNSLKSVMTAVLNSPSSFDVFRGYAQILGSGPANVTMGVLNIPLPHRDKNCH